MTQTLEMIEIQNAGTTDICPNCHQRMYDADVVVMDFAGQAVEHVNCNYPKG